MVIVVNLAIVDFVETVAIVPVVVEVQTSCQLPINDQGTREV